MTPAKIYTFSIPAGGSFPIQAIGEYFKILSASGSLEVRGDTFGTVGVMMPGQGLENTRFSRLELRDLTGSINNVSLVVAGESFVDDRVTGSVEVVDGNKARTLAGQAFSVNSFCGGVAGEAPAIQIWNPPGSGKNVIVDSMLLTITVTSACQWGFMNTPLVTAGLTSVSKLSGGGNSVSVRRSASTPITGPMTGGYLGSLVLSAATPLILPFKGPMVVTPGYGFVIQSQGLANTLTTVSEIIEEAIP